MQADGFLIRIGSFELELQTGILVWLVVCTFVTILLVYGGSKLKKADPTKPPSGSVLIFESLVNMCMLVVKGNLNKLTWKYLPFMGTVMIVMVISNLMGLLGVQPPISNISVPLTLTLMFIILIHGSDIKENGIIGKFKNWLQPMPVLFPLNVIGDLALPVSLTLRQFGNLLGGTIIIALLYFAIGAVFPYSIPAFIVTPFLHMYFDIFAAFMQTYIFFTLTSFFLSDAIGIEQE